MVAGPSDTSPIWPRRPSAAWACSETYQKGPGDDIYANNPVNYVKLDKLPSGDDWSGGIVNALQERETLLDVRGSADSLVPPISGSRQQANHLGRR